MNLDDAIYNWLSIKVVAEARPEDNAARETYEFFGQILTEDHLVQQITVNQNGPWYDVLFTIDGKEKKKQYPIELIDALLESIKAEPKYNQQ